jgi:tetratricopeptide (TPR) repeat protein
MTRQLLQCRDLILALLLGPFCWAQAAPAEEWIEARSSHFTVASDAGDKAARRVAQAFEHIRALVARERQLRLDPDRPIIILAVRDEGSLRALLPRDWELKGHMRPAGAFVTSSDKYYVVLRIDGPRGSVYHEYVHLLVSLNFPRLPPWLNEGLAEFYGAAQIDDATIEWGNIESQRQYLRHHKLLPLEVLLGADYSSPYYREKKHAWVFYYQAATLTHYLLLGPRAPENPFGQFTTLLAEGVSEEEASARAFGDLKSLEKALESYVQQRELTIHGARVRLGNETLTARVIPAREALARRADFLVHTNRLAEALPLLQQARELEPGLGLVYESLGLLNIKQGHAKEALRWLTEGSSRDPQNPLIPYWAAAATGDSLDEETVALKERLLRRVIELSPGFALARRDLADLYQRSQRNLDEALSLAQKACELEPNSEGHRLMLAAVLRKSGQMERAKEVEDGVGRLALADPSLLGLVSRFYEKEKRPTEAEAVLRQAYARRPKDLRTLEALADFLWLQKRYDEAEPLYSEALVIQPDTPSLLNSLSYLYAERSVKLDEALALVDRALVNDPLNGHYRDTRGWVLYRLKRFEEAEKELRKALSHEEDEVVLDHLGDVLQARGAAKDAIELWRRALTYDILDAELKESLLRKVRTAEPLRGSDPAAVQRASVLLQSSVRVRIISNPAEAEVLIAGSKVGSTGARGLLLDLPIGGWVVQVRKAGYLPVEKTVTVEPGADLVIEIRLEPEPNIP